jgi:hypothetical protein
VALSLAILYALGTCDLIGQVLYAGLRPSDTLTLIPIEQILARGIVVGIEAIVTIVALAATLAITEVVFFAIQSVRKSPPRRAAVIRVAILWSIVWCVFISWQVLLQLIPVFVVLFLLRPVWSNPPLRLRAVLVVAVTVAISTSLTTSLIFPDPLPSVDLKDEKQEPIASGELIAETDSTWHLASNGISVAIPTSRVARADIESTSADRESLASWLFEIRLPG